MTVIYIIMASVASFIWGVYIGCTLDDRFRKRQRRYFESVKEADDNEC